ncbi:hypothetical protein D9M72_464310 [compost metagenome]
MPERSGLGGIAQTQKGRPFLGQSLFQIELAGCLDETNGFAGGGLAAGFRQNLCLCGADGGGVRRRNGDHARPAERFGGVFLHESQCGTYGIGGNAVGKAKRHSFCGLDGTPGSDEVDRRDDTDQTRQALRPARARDEAEFDFGEAERCLLAGDATMAGEREFAAAAERSAIHGGDDRLVERLDALDHVRKYRFDRRLAELPDVGATDEGAAGARDDQAPNRGETGRMVERRHQAGANMRRERIDGRIVDGDDENVAFKTGGYALRKSDLGHGGSLNRG